MSFTNFDKNRILKDKINRDWWGKFVSNILTFHSNVSETTLKGHEGNINQGKSSWRWQLITHLHNLNFVTVNAIFWLIGKIKRFCFVSNTLPRLFVFPSFALVPSMTKTRTAEIQINLDPIRYPIEKYPHSNFQFVYNMNLGHVEIFQCEIEVLWRNVHKVSKQGNQPFGDFETDKIWRSNQNLNVKKGG